MHADVVSSENKLLVNLVEDDRLILLQGENKPLRLWLTNAGSKPIGEIWFVAGTDDNIWVGLQESSSCNYYLLLINAALLISSKQPR